MSFFLVTQRHEIGGEAQIVVADPLEQSLQFRQQLADGKTLDDIEIVCRHQCAVTDDVDAARDKLRSHFAPYYATPVYNNFLRWAGQGEAADQIAEGWAARDRAKTTGALHDDLLDKITHVGSREKVQDNIRGLAEAGINTHIIACVVPEAYDATVESFSAANFQF